MNPAGVHVVAIRRGGVETDRVVVAATAIASTRWLQLADVLICPPQPCPVQAGQGVRDTLDKLPGCRVALTRSGSAFLLKSSTGTESSGPWHGVVHAVLDCLGVRPPTAAGSQAGGRARSRSRS